MLLPSGVSSANVNYGNETAYVEIRNEELGVSKEIKKAIESFYGVTVDNVNTIVVPSKAKSK
jgi:hypothetical protein